jgi:hypothetical protein
MGKGSGTSKDQLKLENKRTDAAIAEQQALRGKISANFDKYLSGQEGFDPKLLALMRSDFLNQNDTAFNSAGDNVRASLASRGELSGPVSGGFVRNIAGLEGAKATSQAQGLRGIDMANLQQALTNKFNAGNLNAGQAAQVGQNIGIFDSGAGNSLSNYVRAENTGFGANFVNSFGGALGSGLGSMATGGLGNALTKMGVKTGPQ